MRKILNGLAAAIMAVALALPIFASPAQADGTKSLLDQILERGTLRVGTTGDYPPYSELDQTSSTYKGYEIDAATQLATDLGVKVEFVPTSWETLAAGIQAGKYDVAASGITMTLDRLKSIGFSDAYLDAPLVPLVLTKDGAKFASWRDLDKAGIRIAVQSGTSAEGSAKANFKNAEIVPIVAPALDYQELLSGKVDAAITDTIFIQKALAQYNDKLVAVDPTHAIEGQPIAMMTVRDDPTWQRWLNTWVALKKQSGFFDLLFAKWIAGS